MGNREACRDLTCSKLAIKRLSCNTWSLVGSVRVNVVLSMYSLCLSSSRLIIMTFSCTLSICFHHSIFDKLTRSHVRLQLRKLTNELTPCLCYLFNEDRLIVTMATVIFRLLVIRYSELQSYNLAIGATVGNKLAMSCKSSNFRILEDDC